MIKASINLQDLRQRIFNMAKAEPQHGFGWKRWSRDFLYESLGLFGDYQVKSKGILKGTLYQ